MQSGSFFDNDRFTAAHMTFITFCGGSSDTRVGADAYDSL